MDGVIDLLKPAGMTSHDAVSFLRRITGERKIGHTGTLDPEACGVLVCCLGAGTRYVEYMEGGLKGYRASFQLGIETDTGDIWGAPLCGEGNAQEAGGDASQAKREPCSGGERCVAFAEDELGREAIDPRSYGPFPTEAAVREALASFLGTQQQTPPAYSAVKVNGRPLYKYARSGAEMPQIASRTVEISRLDLITYDRQTGAGTVDLACSRGTYVRSLLCDFGRALGTGATMTFLLRTQSGPCCLEEAVTLEEVTAAAETGAWDSILRPVGYGMEQMPRLQLEQAREDWFRHGGYLTEQDCTEAALHDHNTEEIFAVYGADGTFLGTAHWAPEEQHYRADKVRATR